MGAAGILCDIRDLVLGTTCIGCQVPGPPMCSRCLSLWREPTWRSADGFALAANAYDGTVREAVVAYKEHGIRHFEGLLAWRLATAVAESLRHRTRAGPVVLVPSPPRPGRVFDHAGHLAARAAGLLRSRGIDTLQIAALMSCERPALKGLGRADRELVIRHTMSTVSLVAKDERHLRTGSVFVVDDVITTGATVREARRALDAAGLPCEGACGVAATVR